VAANRPPAGEPTAWPGSVARGNIARMPKPSAATLLAASAFVLVLFGARARTATYRPATARA